MAKQPVGESKEETLDDGKVRSEEDFTDLPVFAERSKIPSVNDKSTHDADVCFQDT